LAIAPTQEAAGNEHASDSQNLKLNHYPSAKLLDRVDAVTDISKTFLSSELTWMPAITTFASSEPLAPKLEARRR
jgi:hypothetical protein